MSSITTLTENWYPVRPFPAPAPKDVSEEERINTELLSNPMKEMIAWLNEQGITKIVPYRTEAANGIRIYFD